MVLVKKNGQIGRPDLNIKDTVLRLVWDGVAQNQLGLAVVLAVYMQNLRVMRWI